MASTLNLILLPFFNTLPSTNANWLPILIGFGLVALESLLSSLIDFLQMKIWVPFVLLGEFVLAVRLFNRLWLKYAFHPFVKLIV
jgi:hypothetical protein